MTPLPLRPLAEDTTNAGYGAISTTSSQRANHNIGEEKYQSSPDNMDDKASTSLDHRMDLYMTQSSSYPQTKEGWIPPWLPLEASYEREAQRNASNNQSKGRIRRFMVGISLFLVMLGAVWWIHTPRRETKQTLKEQDDGLRYDYIVVGGGPSGIVAAAKLARGLPLARILLLESGTASQSSVLANLQQQERHQQSTTMPIDINGQKANYDNHDMSPPPVELNKYDIPLMWSGIANPQRRRQQMAPVPVAPDPAWSNYWPIPLALLARGVGGCGLHNAMIYVRSLPSCFDSWNLTGWSFEDMLPVYKALETFHVDNHDADTNSSSSLVNAIPPDRGDNGPIVTTRPEADRDPIGKYFVEAARASGLPMAGGASAQSSSVNDNRHATFNNFNADDRVGAGFYEFNIHNGVRHSAARAFLGNSIPPNLDVDTGKTVTQVMFGKTTGQNARPQSVGVTFVDSATRKVGKYLLRQSSDKRLSEVILTTGAIMTPQILHNSGIGQHGELVNLPGVGKNLQDHPVLGMAYKFTSDVAEGAPNMYAFADEMEDYTLATQILNELENQQQYSKGHGKQSHLDAAMPLTEKQRQAQKEWAKTQLGTLATSGFSAGAFLRSPWAQKLGNEVPPDIQLTVFPRVTEPHQPKSKRKVDVQFMRSRAMLVTVALLQPEARYEVRPSWYLRHHGPKQTTIPSTVTADSEAIADEFAEQLKYPLPSIKLPDGEQEYLSELDVMRLAWGMKEVRRILSFPPMANITTAEIYPGSSVVDGYKGDLQAYIRANHLANSHWVGTTKMGGDEDPLAVLDAELRVRGVDGLRVLDSGAIPRVPNGNTHSTVCAVASHGAELILSSRLGAYTPRKDASC